LSEPTIPPFDPVSYQRTWDERLTSMTPVEGWRLWIDYLRPMAERGYAVFEHRDAAAIEEIIAGKRFFQKMMLILAGVCVAVAVLAAVWPRSSL
jgi:hypothetical protein